MEYAQDDPPPGRRPKTRGSRSRQTATERLFVVGDPTPACGAKGGKGQHTPLRKCVALELQATTNVFSLFFSPNLQLGSTTKISLQLHIASLDVCMWPLDGPAR